MKTVLFDLDGTLLPMDLDYFVKHYFEALAAHFVPYGYEAKRLLSAVWKSTDAMLANDGSRTNEEVFWDGMESIYGGSVRSDVPLFDEFYETDFKGLKCFCGYNADAAATVARLAAEGTKLVLASNPVFPYAGQAERLAWADIDPRSFDYVTTYSNSHYCKPKTGYYKEIAERICADPSECLMVGNDVSDDGPAIDAGFDFFLLTDCLINKGNADLSKYRRGGYAELNAYLEEKGFV